MARAASVSERPLLGEILLERGLVSQAQLAQALRIQVGGVRRLGHILVQMKVISDEDLTGALSRQLGLPVIDVAGAFRPEAAALLPRHLCRRFGVIPLALEANNVLRLGMADPLDREAIAAVEHFTGNAVDPALARLGDILRAIPRLVSISRHDLFNPQVYRAGLIASATLVLLLSTLLGYSAYKGWRERVYGRSERTATSTVYRNHDLRVEAYRTGPVHLSGRAAHADGLYGVQFEGAPQLQAFVSTQERVLSGEQREWLGWLVEERLRGGGAQTAARGAP